MAKSRFCEKLVPYIWFIPYLVILNYTYRFFKEQKGFPTPAFYETSSVINTVNTTSVSMSPYPLLQDAGKVCHNPDVPLSDSFFSVNRKNVSASLLCKLNMTAYCGSVEPSEVVDGYWVVCPAYASFQTFIQYRYILHENYKGYIESFGLMFSTIEAIRKDRNQKYLLTRPGSEPYEIQIEFWDDMYIRENFLNVAARKIPNWDYFAWIDTHQIFENVYWWEESIVQAEKYASVQLFKFFQNFDLHNVTDSTSQAALRLSQVLTSFDFGGPRVLGNAYVIRKELYDKIDIIYDECVASCCDCAWILASVERDFHFSGFASLFGYTNQMHPWINHTRSVFNASRITTRGTLYHLYHEHNFNYLPMLFAMNETDFVFKRDLVRDENRTLRIQNEEIKKYFEKDTFWMNFNYYVKENHIDFYAHAFGSILVSLAIAYLVQRFAKRR